MSCLATKVSKFNLSDLERDKIQTQNISNSEHYRNKICQNLFTFRTSQESVWWSKKNTGFEDRVYIPVQMLTWGWLVQLAGSHFSPLTGFHDTNWDTVVLFVPSTRPGHRQCLESRVSFFLLVHFHSSRSDRVTLMCLRWCVWYSVPHLIKWWQADLLNYYLTTSLKLQWQSLTTNIFTF